MNVGDHGSPVRKSSVEAAGQYKMLWREMCGSRGSSQGNTQAEKEPMRTRLLRKGESCSEVFKRTKDMRLRMKKGWH